MLDLCNTLSSSSVILGDLNEHLHILTLFHKIYSLLNRYSFDQAVTVPTHKLGHTLGIAMFRPTDDIVCSTTVTQLLLYHHISVTCDLSAVKPVNNTEVNQCRNTCGIDLKTFKADIWQSTLPTSFEMLAANLMLVIESTHICAYSECQQIEMIHSIKQ